MNVYYAYKFLSGLKGLRRDEKQLKTSELKKTDPRPRQLSTTKTEDSIQNIGNLIHKNRHLSVRALAEISGIKKKNVRLGFV